MAWVPIAVIANPGAGIDGDGNGTADGNVSMTQLQHLFVTGRMSSGENLMAVTDVGAFESAYPQIIVEGVDVNGDGLINVQDINGFVALLTGSGVDVTGVVIPEPSAVILLAVVGLYMVRRRR